ncbi:MAG TPA: PRC-barrel domain-containing protein [Anaerolineales bacterium]|nr:PRC-barrel domain-containing protein [Anaerolineales bacterium]
MQFVKGAEVFNSAGEQVGTVSRVVIDVKTSDVTDLVIERGALFKDEKVIPVQLLDATSEDRIVLRESNQSVDDLPNYETTHYVPVDQKGAPYTNVETSYWYPPINFQTPAPGRMPAVPVELDTRTEPSIPEGRVAITEGASVISADDKHVGNVEQVIMNSEGKGVTHFVIGKGFLLKEHKLVPAHWASSMDDEEKIRLSVDASLFDRLPEHNPD